MTSYEPTGYAAGVAGLTCDPAIDRRLAMTYDSSFTETARDPSLPQIAGGSA